jgi:hypothetical protein
MDDRRPRFVVVVGRKGCCRGGGRGSAASWSSGERRRGCEAMLSTMGSLLVVATELEVAEINGGDLSTSAGSGRGRLWWLIE